MDNKKRKIVGISIAVCAIFLCGSIVACNQSRKSNVTESTEVPEVKLTDKVTGIKDWTVEVNSTGINFMEDVSWDKDFVTTVTVDDSDVNLTKVGEYTLTYTIKGITSKEETQDASVDVTEVKATESEEPTETQTATVDVISEEDTQAKVNDGDSVTTSNNDVEGNTTSTNNSSGNSTTTAPVAEPVKEPTYRTIHHDAITHEEDQGYWEVSTYPVWITTNWLTGETHEFTSTDALNEYYDYLDENEPEGWDVTTDGVIFRETKTWIPNIVTVVDTPAWDEVVEE